jgi:hypothetical protein
MKSILRVLLVVALLFPCVVRSECVDLTIDLYSENPVLKYSGTGWYQGSWFDASRTAYPTVIKVNDQYYLYYDGMAYNNHHQVGLATSSDGVNWMRHSNYPVIPYGVQAWCLYRVRPGSVIYEDGLFKMWIEGNRENLYDPMKVGYAVSNDGMSWTMRDANPILAEPTTSYVSNVIKIGTTYYLYYSDGNPRGDYLRTSNDGFTLGERIAINGGEGKMLYALTKHSFNQTEFIFSLLRDNSTGLHYYGISLDGTNFYILSNPITSVPANEISATVVTSIFIENGLMKFWAHYSPGNITWDYSNYEVWYGTAPEPDWSKVFGCLLPNQPPVADAAQNLTIASESQAATIIRGLASDPDNTPINYRWLEGTEELLTWQSVGANGEAPLDLSTVPHLSIGEHTLTLEVSDGQSTLQDDMILTINNSAPHPAPTGGGVYSYGSPITLGGQVSDFDGEMVDYEWREGGALLFSGQVQTIYQGTPVDLPVYELSGLGLGDHTVTLCANDSVNAAVCKDISVSIIDTTAPIIAPVPNKTILWPPNHKMADITIVANASDNSGAPVTLVASVSSNEPEDGLGDGDMSPDWTEPVIDQANGIITLQLRAERSGSGNGRVYTIAITATDPSNNSSQASVQIIVPHDKRNK